LRARARAQALRCRKREDSPRLPQGTALRFAAATDHDSRTQRTYAGQRLAPELLSPALSGSDLGPDLGGWMPGGCRPWLRPRCAGPSAGRAGHPDGRPVLARARLDGLRTKRPELRVSRLPAKRERRKGKSACENWRRNRDQQQRTQIFIETPYRNRQMLASLINTCAPGTRICVATDLTLAEEQITTRPVADWRRQQLPETNRRPTVFLLQA
jgi:16S rRNA (cytidine1402-2'-O)-methyltransferase